MPSRTKHNQRKKSKRKGNARLVQWLSEKREFRCPPDVFETMVESHQDVLQNIEFAIALAWRGDATIDDLAVKQALMASLRGDARETGGAKRVQEMLTDAREARPEIADLIWHNGLLVILDSVGNHSSTAPGARNYLHFIDDYIV